MTRGDIDDDVARGKLLETLFYRLAGARIAIPPLKDRPGDIAKIANEMWASLGKKGELATSVLATFERYAWPGNVRELQHAVARQAALGELAEPVVRSDTSTPTYPTTELLFSEVLSLGLPLVNARARVVETFERSYLAYTLEQHRGNVTRAAAAAGIARRYFQVLKARHGGRT